MMCAKDKSENGKGGEGGWNRERNKGRSGEERERNRSGGEKGGKGNVVPDGSVNSVKTNWTGWPGMQNEWCMWHVPV